MHLVSLRLTAIVLVLLPVAAGQSGVPFPREERLFYAVSWPSGLTLGDGELSAVYEPGASGQPGHWRFQLRLDAAVPTFAVSDRVNSVATDDLCSVEFQRELRHGDRVTKEHTEFDLAKGTAKRQTLEGGGSSELSIGSCPQDALAFVYAVRQQLARGRIPPHQMIYYGAAYEMRLEYVRAETVRVGDKTIRGERLRAHIKGDVSEHTFEIVFERQGGYRPLRVQVPLELGNFSMDLQP